MWLRVKIMVGYLFFVVFLCFTIYYFRKEQMVRSRLQNSEHELLRVRKLAERTYAGLLELATQGETVIVWDHQDFALYRKKRAEVWANLMKLKSHFEPGKGQNRIDSLCVLLEQKEHLLDSVMQTFHRLQHVGEFINRKIPAIVSHVQEAAADSASVTAADSLEVEVKPKRNLWDRLFGGKSKKSAYLQQREKMLQARERQAVQQQQQAASATDLLHSLKEEVSEHQAEEREELISHMDYLYKNNVKLNRRLHCIIQNLESEERQRLEERYRNFAEERDESFGMLSFLSFSIFLLSVFLYIIVHRDLKRKFKYERELEVSNREKQQLLQSRHQMMLSIAHDLRAPIATVSGSAELLVKETETLERMRNIDNIRYASDYMLSLVDTLMEFYQLDTGQVHRQVSLFHARTLFQEVADSFLPAARKKDLLLSVSFTGMDVVVGGDKKFLQQILNNLLSNAIKFTEKGSVRLEAEYRQEQLCIMVEDTGIGIAQEDIQKLFVAFERLGKTDDGNGFGLGLAITSRLVQEMGGTIQVESTLGKGSRFTVRLPLSLANGTCSIENRNAMPQISLEHKRILLLDDDPRQLGIAKGMFRRSKAVCDGCTDSRGLIALLRENEYDILLMDIQMPDMNGFEVLELLRSSNIPQGLRIPVVALTARMDDEQEFLTRGFAGCIRKPYSMENLVGYVAGLIGTGNKDDWKPDFSLILTGEENQKEMLEVFVKESLKDLHRLRTALQDDDRKLVWEVLHKNLPLWETVRLDYPIESLRRIVVSDSAAWNKNVFEEIGKIERAAEKLIQYAETMKETG